MMNIMKIGARNGYGFLDSPYVQHDEQEDQD